MLVIVNNRWWPSLEVKKGKTYFLLEWFFARKLDLGTFSASTHTLNNVRDQKEIVS
ncbi:hypothetical protein M378DRAFT_169307 [Amanita muscaria Koide BX008]|uniref:Uncharacterized protein n=1 Tax=Amanita muscaria (strain Koide BX008) TaxID=946122 RepID=A0A0C2WSQ8_AMAMK|nr:hypothetical protein M378DRAFT_169307 [Amanita muscaria Koide BX008]